MRVAPRQNLASLLLSRTWALHGSGGRPDQMMACTTLALHQLSFLPPTEPKLPVSLFDVIHPALCPGLIYNALLTAQELKCWVSAWETILGVEGGSWVLAFNPHHCFIRANKGGLHHGSSSRLGLLSHATCMEQPAIHMQI